MKMDGDLSAFKDAFSTPVEYFNSDLKNRAGQFFFMWDDEAFYAGCARSTWPANHSDDNHLWEGDAVEWYFDTRQDENARSQAWGGPGGSGAVHCYWTGLKGTEVNPRFCLRPGYLDAIKKIGVEVAAKRTAVGMDVEFKMPWVNFPNFKPGLNAVIALDSELCYSDGGGRVFRSFVFGSPLSVQQPANLSKMQLVDKLVPAYWAACGPVAIAPIHCDTAWTQKTRPHVTGYMALPPNQTDQIGKVVFPHPRLERQNPWRFPRHHRDFCRRRPLQRATAQWPTDLAMPGAHGLLGVQLR